MDDSLLCFWAAPPEALFPPRVIAKVRNVSTSALERERWLAAGPPYLKVRGRVLYRKSDLLAWIDEVAERPVQELSLLHKSTPPQAAPCLSDARTRGRKQPHATT
jgi:hypothetical protein